MLFWEQVYLADRRFVFFSEARQEDGSVEPQAEIRQLSTGRMSSWGTGIGLACCILLLLVGLKPTNRLHHHLTLGHDALDYGNRDRVSFHLNMAQMLDPADPGVALLEARHYCAQRNLTKPNRYWPMRSKILAMIPKRVGCSSCDKLRPRSISIDNCFTMHP